MSLPEELFYEFVKRPTSDHKAAKLLLERQGTTGLIGYGAEHGLCHQ